MSEDAIRLIDKLYDDLYKDKQVLHHGTNKVSDKLKNIESYIKTMERVHDKASNNEHRIKMLKSYYYDKYVIKRENIPESYFPLVKTGMKINVRSEIYPDKIFPATIEIVYPTIDAATHTFQAKIKIPNSKELLRPGMFVSTTLDLGEQETIVVPYQAVLKLQGANNRYVFLNDNGVAKRVDVTLGARFDDKIEVLANEIKEGCEVVVIGQARLVDGKKLEIVNRK